MTENDVTARKHQDCHIDEDFTSRGKGSTSAEDGETGLVGASARKGRAVGRGYRCTESAH
jgi:hypothetical protein